MQLHKATQTCHGRVVSPFSVIYLTVKLCCRRSTYDEFDKLRKGLLDVIFFRPR